MLLSIAQTATALGKSERQIRYLIKLGRLEFQQKGGRFFIDSEKLPLSPQQASAITRNVAAAQAAMQGALQPAAAVAAPDKPGKAHYSVTELKPFQLGEAVYRELCAAHGADDAAAAELREVLALIARSCHCYHPAHKVERLNLARDRLADALTTLLLAGDPTRRALALRIEQELFPRLSGLLASHERRFRRSRFERFDASSRSGSG